MEAILFVLACGIPALWLCFASHQTRPETNTEYYRRIDNQSPHATDWRRKRVPITKRRTKQRTRT